MIAVASIHHSDMDLLRADDQMDLALSPVMPKEDIDFELDDVRDLSTEPNQDLMLQDEPEQPVLDSELMHSMSSEHADDDLMLDEDAIVQQDNLIDLPELAMANRQDEPAQADDDDDILYEDEEDLQKQADHPQGSFKEQEMEDDFDADRLQATQEAQSADGFTEELHVAATTDVHADGGSQRAEDTNNMSKQLQIDQARAPADASDNNRATGEPGSIAILDQDLRLGPLEDAYSTDAHEQDANEEHGQADFEPNQNHVSGHDVAATNVNESNSQDPEASESPSQPGPLGSHSRHLPQTDANSIIEEIGNRSASETPLLHAVKVHYLEAEMCLFPPTEDDESEMFFLEDVSLAHGSLDKMLGACRDVLANTIGQDDELVLDVASLGLHISEGSRYAAQITLSQILDVYSTLARNDNIASIEPLHCSLSSRVCLASQYAYLQSAATEGKTLTQIFEENTYVSGEDGGNGEEGLEYDQAEMYHHKNSAESNNKVEAVFQEERKGGSPQPEQDLTQESKHARAESTDNGNNHDREGGPLEKKGDDPKEIELEGELSATSTIKGDSNETEGDYHISLDLCFKPGICSCSKCANTNADGAALGSDKHDNDELTEGLLAGAARITGDPDPLALNTPATEIQVTKPDSDSNVQESVSSRTIEGENNQPEEDIFSQNNQQMFEDGLENYTDTQHDDFEDFDLEEQKPEDRGLEADDSASPKAGIEPENHNLGVDHMAPNATLDMANDEYFPGQTRTDNQDVSHVEDDDELLNFDDDAEGEETEENQEIFESTYAPQDSEKENLRSDSTPNDLIKVQDVTRTSQDDRAHSENVSSKAHETRWGQSPAGQLQHKPSVEPVGDAPSTPLGGNNGSKRKAPEDEDDFDLFDTATPDKKRRRPSP